MPRCQDLPEEAFLTKEAAADCYAEGRRGIFIVSYCWRSPGVPDPDGRTLETVRGHLDYLEREEDGVAGCGLFVDVACLPQTFAIPSWHHPEPEALRFGADADKGALTVLHLEWEPVETEDEAEVKIDNLTSLCQTREWKLASMSDLEGIGPLPGSGCDRPKGSDGVIFHGRYVSGTYRFDQGATTKEGKGPRTAAGFVLFCSEDDAKAAQCHPELIHMCDGRKPKLMGQRVFENDRKFQRALSVMGCLYASAAGTRVLQLTDPPGDLGKELAPSELISKTTGTVFIVRSTEEKLLQELDGKQDVLAYQRGLWGAVVVRVHGESVAKAARWLKETRYPLQSAWCARNKRVVYPMYNVRPYFSRGWPTFETAAAKIVLAHINQRKRLRPKRLPELPPHIMEAEESGLKLVNINTANALEPVDVKQSPEHLLRECKALLQSQRRIFFTGSADRKVVVQLLVDFEDSVAAEFDERRAAHLNFTTKDLTLAVKDQLQKARKARFGKSLRRIRVEPMPLVHRPLSLDPEPPMLDTQRSHKSSDKFLPDTGPVKERPPPRYRRAQANASDDGSDQIQLDVSTLRERPASMQRTSPTLDHNKSELEHLSEAADWNARWHEDSGAQPAEVDFVIASQQIDIGLKEETGQRVAASRLQSVPQAIEYNVPIRVTTTKEQDVESPAPRFESNATVLVTHSNGAQMQARVLNYDPDQAKYLVEVDGRRKYCRERSMVLVAEPGSQAPTELPRPEVLPPSMVEQISLWTKRMRQQLGEQLLDSFGPRPDLEA